MVVFKGALLLTSFIFPFPLPHAGVDEWRAEKENRRADGNGIMFLWQLQLHAFEVMM